MKKTRWQDRLRGMIRKIKKTYPANHAIEGDLPYPVKYLQFLSCYN